jgi:soluble lytic murein transglycosylase-like protein
MLFRDGERFVPVQLALTRAILHTNARITPMGALLLADLTVRTAQSDDLSPEFLGATLLQESAYDPTAISSAGAWGIAQFEPSTAAEYGVDPLDADQSIAGAGQLLSSYVHAYRRTSSDPYSLAMAAYNAGPGAVSEYHGVPPYAETREYISDILDRWAQIASFEVPPSAHPKSRRNHRTGGTNS